ncbi:MAG TPA: hypothetical protein VMH04_05755 [Candidatus Solibacter sp.]|nr:hypothetical protein [Candidatus Solibacter sp.]
MPENSSSSEHHPSCAAFQPAQDKRTFDFQHCLQQYGAAALGVVAVSAVASAQVSVPTHNIIYIPANIAVDTGALRSTITSIDLNRDGVTDLWLIASHFTDFFSGGGHAGYGRITVSMGAGNFAIVSHALPKGMIIDKGGSFKSGRHSIAYAGSISYKTLKDSTAQGPFVNVKNKYLGLRFLINGKMHEGWIRFTLAPKGDRITGAITGYAFDTVPNETGLAAGQIGGRVGAGEADSKVFIKDTNPASLGMLAAGAEAIPYWRK